MKRRTYLHGIIAAIAVPTILNDHTTAYDCDKTGRIPSDERLTVRVGNSTANQRSGRHVLQAVYSGMTTTARTVPFKAR